MRKPLIAAALTLFALVATAPAHAQEGQMDPKAMEQMMMQLATPGAPHQQLATMAGKWTTTQTMYMEGAPETTTGTYEGEAVLGGRYMLGRFKATMMGQPFEGMEVSGYDNGTQKFFSIWFDMMGTGYYLSHGTASADGKTVSHTGTMTMGPMEIPSRSETVFVDKDTVKFTMWHTMGGQEMKAMEMEYKRAR
jgi:hypothetical protein